MKEFTPFTTRKPLIEQLPLSAPLGIHLAPSTYCNFKCHYCVHSNLDEAKVSGGGGTPLT